MSDTNATAGPAGPRAVFAERFALLYAEAGEPALKQVVESVARARRVDEAGRPVRVTVQRVSDWRRGRNVPARFAGLEAVLTVLVGQARKRRPRPVVSGLYELAAWRRLWEQALATPVAADPAGLPTEDTGVCPYRGLAAFGVADADWFFGRDRATEALVELVRAVSATEVPASSETIDATKPLSAYPSVSRAGLVMLVGASGAGKSSLLRAGLVPALTRGAVDGSADWPARVITPGSDPIAALTSAAPSIADTLTAALAAPAWESDADPADLPAAAHQLRHGVRAAFTNRSVLVVDQFEELFTLCPDEDRRRVFVQALHAACTGPDAPTLVVLGLRADFYGRCLDYPELVAASQHRQLVLGPMRAAEVREAIAGPARAVGLKLENGLVELLLRDLGVRTGGVGGTYDAGALPLLSHALLATWQRRSAGRLTITGYQAAGGIQGAVAATAEQTWRELGAAGQAVARPLLLRLVRVGEDDQDTRRRSTREELMARAAASDAAGEVLEALASARLVTLDDGSVEITHEALLKAWPRLRGWIDEDRAGALTRQRLEDDAAAWEAAGRDSSLLYRGARLEMARSAVGIRFLSERDSKFDESPDGSRDDRVNKDAENFLNFSEKIRQRSVRIRRSVVGAVTSLALIAGGLAVVAVEQRDDARYKQVLADADRLQEINPSLSAQLALVARRMRPAENLAYSRIISMQNKPLYSTFPGHVAAVNEINLSSDGKILIVASNDKTFSLWDAHDPSRLKILNPSIFGHSGSIYSAELSPNGHFAVTASSDRSFRLWDVSNPIRVVSLTGPVVDHSQAVYSASFDPSGKFLVSASLDGSFSIWDLKDISRPRKILGQSLGSNEAIYSARFSPSGKFLATASKSGLVRLWDLTGRSPVLAAPPLKGHASVAYRVCFSSDGKLLATASFDKTLNLWNLDDLRMPKLLNSPLTGHSGAIYGISFNSDGNSLITSSDDKTIILWSRLRPDGEFVRNLTFSGSDSTILSVTFAPGGKFAFSSGVDGAVRSWKLPEGSYRGHKFGLTFATYAKDGRKFATGDYERFVRIWDMQKVGVGSYRGTLLDAHKSWISSIDFSRDGNLMATSSADLKVSVWNIQNLEKVHLQEYPITGFPAIVRIVKFSSDSKSVVVARNDGKFQFFDLGKNGTPSPLGLPVSAHSSPIFGLNFDDSGEILVTTSDDRSFRIWDVKNRSIPKLLGGVENLKVGTIYGAVFSKGRKLLATFGSDKLVHLWDVENLSNVRHLNVLKGHSSVIRDAAFDPKGKALATASFDGTFRLWKLEDVFRPMAFGEGIGGNEGNLNSLSFSPDGLSLLTAHDSGVAQIWNLDISTVEQELCRFTRGVLTADLWFEHVPEVGYDPPCEADRTAS